MRIVSSAFIISARHAIVSRPTELHELPVRRGPGARSILVCYTYTYIAQLAMEVMRVAARANTRASARDPSWSNKVSSRINLVDVKNPFNLYVCVDSSLQRARDMMRSVHIMCAQLSCSLSLFLPPTHTHSLYVCVLGAGRAGRVT